MFGRKHTEDTINKQKNKAKGRFSLEWFVNKYGNEEGNKKYEERRQFLKNRKINYSYPKISKPKSKIKIDKDKIINNRNRMKVEKVSLIDDIKMDKFTVNALAKKYNVSINTVKYYKKKIVNGMI